MTTHSVGVFDPNLDLIAFNSLFQLIHDYPDDLCRPGASLRRLLEYDYAKQQLSYDGSIAPVNAWLRRAEHRNRYSGEEQHAGVEGMKKVYPVVASFDNVYVETGGWSEKNFEVAFESGMSAAQMMWGHDYGNVPQYIYRENIMNYNPTPEMVSPWDYRKTVSFFMRCDSDFPEVPTYQSDFYGWGLRTVDRVGDWLPQDEINLILGGTAAKLYKLPVPYPRMFPEGRPDIYGDKWEESIPYLPDDQIQHPEDVKMSTKPFYPKKHK